MIFDIRDIEPAVSVSLITYNHAPYIRECLDSLLNQETDFPYEICMGEDESSDGTREICIEYAEKYPEKIRLILRSQSEAGREKYCSQGVYNFIETCRDCRGKYQAICDGDDAWIDPLKLQKQYEIMENDPSISLVHSKYLNLDDLSGLEISKNSVVHEADEDAVALKCKVILRDYVIASSTTFVKTKDLLDIFENNTDMLQELPMGDTPVWCELLNYGSFYLCNEPMAIYRRLAESDSNSLSAEKKYSFVNGAANLGIICGKKYNLPMGRLRLEKVKSCNRYALLSGKRDEIEELYADNLFHFTLGEKLFYHAGRLEPIRRLTKLFYEMRYNINNRRLNA